MRKHHSGTTKRALFALLTVLLFFLAAEGVARLSVSPWGATQQEHAHTISVLGLPELNSVMEPDRFLFWRLRQQLSNQRVRGEIRQHPIDFAVTTNNHLRQSGVIPAKSVFRVLALGDSCTFGVGVNDTETWPSQLEAISRARGLKLEVINAGVPGYTAFQGRRYLEKEGLILEPDMVLVCFGFNDADVWASRGDRQTAVELASEQSDSILMKSRFFVGIQRLLLPAIDSVAGGGEPSMPEGSRGRSVRPRLTTDEFEENLRGIKQLCDDRGIRMVAVIWPFESQVRQNVRRLLDYQLITSQFCDRNQISNVNVVRAFQRSEEELFLDHIHATPAGCRVAAEEIAKLFRPKPSAAGFPADGPEIATNVPE